MKCPICNIEKSTLLYDINNVEIRKCNECGLAFYDFNNIDFNDIYDKNYFKSEDNKKGYSDYEALKTSLVKTFKKRLKKINELKKTDGNKVLDIGCGMGYFLHVCKNNGFDISGLEISDYASNYASNLLEVDIINEPFKQNIFTENTFDIVTLWDVIEHLPDPIDVIKGINKAIKKRGLFVLTTGNMNSIVHKTCKEKWHLINIPEHIFYYNNDNIKKLLEENGFEVVKVKHESSYYTLNYLKERLNKTLGFNFKKNDIGESIVLPINLFDIMTVYAYKK